MSQQEPDARLPFVELSKKLSDIFELTSLRLKLISDSISSSIHSEAFQLNPTPPQSQDAIHLTTSPSNHPIPKVSEFSNHPAPSLQPEATTLIPLKRPNSSSHLTQVESHKTFDGASNPQNPRDGDRATSIPCIVGIATHSNSKAPTSPHTPSSPSNTLDGISDPIGSERVHESSRSNSRSIPFTPSLPDHHDQISRSTVNQDESNHLLDRLSSNLNSTIDSDHVPRLAPKSLLERIAISPLTARTAIASNRQPPESTTFTTLASSHASSMDLANTSNSPDTMQSTKRDDRLPSPTSSSRRHSSSSSTSARSEIATSRPVKAPQQLSTRQPSPAHSRDSRKSYHPIRPDPRTTSRDTYESYHPPPQSTSYRSRSRSRSTPPSRRRSSVTSYNRRSTPIEDRGRRRDDLLQYLEYTTERPSYMRFTSILRSLHGRDYRNGITSNQLLREFDRFARRAETREERTLGYIYDNPHLLHPFIKVAQDRRIVTYRPNLERLRDSTVKLDVGFRQIPKSNFRR